MDKKWIGVGLAAIVVAYLLFMKTKVPQPAPVNTPPPGPGVIAEKIVPVTSKTDFAAVVKQENMERQEYDKKVSLGIITGRFPVENGNIKLTIKIKPEVLYCRGGETDTMKLSATNLFKPEFLLSVEAIDKTTKPLLAKRYRVETLEKGDVVTVLVPALQNQLYGVYLCHDRNNKQSCKDKKVLDYIELSEKRGTVGKKSDYLYVFHKFLVRPGGFLDMFSAKADNKQFKGIADYIAKEGGVSAKTIAATETSERSIRSRALRLIGTLIELPLTVGDHSCMPTGGTKQNPAGGGGKQKKTHSKTGP